MKHMLKPSETKHLKPKCDKVLSTFAFKFNSRRYVKNGVTPVTKRSHTQRRGYSFNKGSGKWKAQCGTKFLGSHTTEEAAAQAGAVTRSHCSST